MLEVTEFDLVCVCVCVCVCLWGGGGKVQRICSKQLYGPLAKSCEKRKKNLVAVMYKKCFEFMKK
jgi:hypothetical protein